MHRDSRGYYAALHIRPDAGPQEIRRAFRALMRQRHPDVGGRDIASGSGTPAAGDSDARAILAAFTVLRDPVTRSAYDRAEASRAEAGRAEREPAEAGRAGQGHPGRGRVDVTSDATSTDGGREIPIRVRRHPEPALRIMPVRWERGPFTPHHVPQEGRL